MNAPNENSMEDILASIKRVIAEEKQIRTSASAAAETGYGGQEKDQEDDVLELSESVEPPAAPPPDLGPPLMEEEAVDTSRQRLVELASVAATAPPQPVVNPLEDMIREMLRPILKQWIDDHLPGIVDEHVRREIHRITGRPV